MKRSAFFILFTALMLQFTACRYSKKEYYPNGTVRSVVHMKGGKYYGKYEYYDTRGNIELECYYKDNILQGPLTRYYAYKRKKEVQNYDKGVLEGLSTSWYDDGTRSREATYMNGVLSGPYHEYYRYNQIMVDGQYLQGFFTGKWLYYNQAGDVIGDAQFRHGTGVQRAFFPDGKISHLVHFRDNLKEGEEIIYDSTGAVISLRLYHLDTLVNGRK